MSFISVANVFGFKLHDASNFIQERLYCERAIEGIFSLQNIMIYGPFTI